MTPDQVLAAHGIDPVYHWTAEAIVLNDQPLIRVAVSTGQHVGYFRSPQAMVAAGIDLARVTVR